MKATISAGLNAQLPADLIGELLNAYEEAKTNFYLGGLRLSGVEGGRFCEAAFRLLQQITTGRHDPLGKSVHTERLARNLAALPVGSYPDSIRLHLPRALRVVYDVRNNRDLAHLGDGIDPNLQDASLVISVLDWVLAEFVRLFHNVSADEAQALVADLVTRRAPAVEDFDGFLKVLRTDLQASSYVLLLLYQRGSIETRLFELEQWVHPKMRANLRRTLQRLVHDLAFVHESVSGYRITRSGQREVERLQLVHD